MVKTKSETTSWHKASKLIRCLVVSLIATFALALFPSAAWADTIPWTRLSGETRYDTMKAISSAGWSNSSSVIVASAANFPDALAASSLAGTKSCPILLTDPNSLSSQTSSQIKSLGAKNVFIIGGNAAISTNVESQIKKLGCTTQRLAGSTRQGTATSLASYLGSSHGDTCIIATGKSFADALSISPYAYAKRAPIYLTEGDGTLSSATLSAIKSQGYSRAVIVGGTGVVSTKAESQLKQIGLSSQTRLGGEHRYETSAKIASWCLGQGMNVTNVGVALGDNFPDALAGGALCGKNNSVLLLANASNTSNAASVVSANKANIAKGYVFGGKAVVSDNTANTVFFTSKNPTSEKYSYEMYVLGSADVPTYSGCTTIIYFKTKHPESNLYMNSSAEYWISSSSYADLDLPESSTNGLYKVDGGYIAIVSFDDAGTHTVSLREWDSAARTYHTLKSFEIKVEDYEAAENAFIDEVIAKCTTSKMDSFEKMEAVSNYLYSNFTYLDSIENGRYGINLAKRSAPYFVTLRWDSYVSPAKLCKFAERIGGFDDIHNCYWDYSRSDPEWSYVHFLCKVTKGKVSKSYMACPNVGTSEISSYKMIDLSDTASFVHLDPTAIRRKVK